MTETAAMIDDRKRPTMTNGWSPAMRPDAGRRNGLAAPRGADLAEDYAMEPAAPCTVVIEPRIFFRDCVLASLENVAPATRFLAFGSVEEWAGSDAVLATDLVVLWRAADEASSGGIEDIARQVAAVRQASPDAPLALMSNHEDLDFVQKVMDVGANAFIPTSLGLKATIRVFDLVRAGGAFIPASCLASAARPQAAQAPGSAELAGLFSPKQLAVARALRKGMPNKLIAYELNMCESTVKVHVRTIMKKLKARNRTEVAFLTQSLGATT
ncbi:helix-turn-helix transcriptional regulator [Camelimonas sp. ID_303_24]